MAQKYPTVTVMHTDFGEVELPQSDLLSLAMENAYKVEYETRYNEYTGEPYKIPVNVAAGNKFSEALRGYEAHINALAEPIYIAGGDTSEVKPPLFDDWLAQEGISLQN